MKLLQVRDVMFTTANHKNADGSNMEGWTDVNGTVRKDGEVSDRMGWGVPDLDKGMYGPGQFLGKFEYNMPRIPLTFGRTTSPTWLSISARLKMTLGWTGQRKTVPSWRMADIITG